MLYIGMIFSMFAWHVEDHYLYRYTYTCLVFVFVTNLMSTSFFSALIIITAVLPRRGTACHLTLLFNLRRWYEIRYTGMPSYRRTEYSNGLQRKQACSLQKY